MEFSKIKEKEIRMSYYEFTVMQDQIKDLQYQIKDYKKIIKNKSVVLILGTKYGRSSKIILYDFKNKDKQEIDQQLKNTVSLKRTEDTKIIEELKDKLSNISNLNREWHTPRKFYDKFKDRPIWDAIDKIIKKENENE